MDRYKHSETGWVIIAAMLAACALSPAGAASRGCGESRAIFFLPPFFLALLANFYKLTVLVDDKSVKLSMGVGFIKKTFLFEEIGSAGPAASSLLGGWGIRYLGNGWLFNVNSLQAVEFKMKNGRRYQIGTDDPGGLHAALLAAGIPPHAA